MISNQDSTILNNDQILEAFHETRNNARPVRCIKEKPAMYGFGRDLEIGDIVIINGVIERGGQFFVAVPEECAFYLYSYFEFISDPI